MPIPIIPLVYVSLCLICGLVARKTRLGFWAGFIIAIVITPVVCLLALLLARWIAGGQQTTAPSE